MEPTTQLLVTVEEVSQAAEARRAAVAMADRLGFGQTAASKVALVVTEAATNLAKHGRRGLVVLRDVSRGGVGGLEVLALDRGPGIADVGRALTDGFSTAGSPGTGLGAIRRLSGLFDVHSLTEVGTVVLAQVWAGAMPPAPAVEIGAIYLPHPGEEMCGDGWAVIPRVGGARILVVDGLGHGAVAADAARAAIRVFAESGRLTPGGQVEALHAGLRGTRGAAVAVADVDRQRRLVRFAGIGNIAGCVVAGTRPRHLVSHNGIAGHAARKIDEFTYPWPDGGVLVLHTDGLASRWDLARYPGILARHPSIVAGVLVRDFSRGRDDVTVVAAREVAA
jgi:anti-sigma regulatory factor (Ser/Thr protein kinase)